MAFAIAALFVPSAPQKALFVIIAVACALTAPYRVWLTAKERAEASEKELALSRPLLIPEAVVSGAEVSLALTNVGRRPALEVSIDTIRSFDGVAEFDTIQILRPEDGRVLVGSRVTRSGGLRDVLGRVHLAATLSMQREGKAGTNFDVPFVFRYADPTGHSYEERSFGFSWIPSVTNIPADTQFLVRRLERVSSEST